MDKNDFLKTFLFRLCNSVLAQNFTYKWAFKSTLPPYPPPPPTPLSPPLPPSIIITIGQTHPLQKVPFPDHSPIIRMMLQPNIKPRADCSYCTVIPSDHTLFTLEAYIINIKSIQIWLCSTDHAMVNELRFNDFVYLKVSNIKTTSRESRIADNS